MSSTDFEDHPVWNTCGKINSYDGWKPVDDDRCLDANLIFMRVFKTGTSSMSGVLLRIAARHGLNGVQEKFAEDMPEPLVSTSHFHRYQWHIQPFVQKIKEFTKPNIMVTMVRDPVERWLSHYYYRATKDEDSGKDVLEFLKTYSMDFPDFQMTFLRDGAPTEVDVNQGPAEVVHSYPLVGLTERFDESVVMLMYLLGIDNYCDVLFVDSKVSTSGVDRHGDHWQRHIPLEEQPEKVKNFIASEEFQKSIELDLNLHKIANLRLDHQIQFLGQNRFAKRLKVYRKWLKQAQSSCEDDETGFEGCYMEDLGCKYKCLDSFCAAHGDAMKVDDDVTPSWQDQIFKTPLVQSIHD